jgi:hypothetical protein
MGILFVVLAEFRRRRLQDIDSDGGNPVREVSSSRNYI